MQPTTALTRARTLQERLDNQQKRRRGGESLPRLSHYAPSSACRPYSILFKNSFPFQLPMRRNPCVKRVGEIIATELDSSDGWIVCVDAPRTLSLQEDIKHKRKFEIDQLASRTFSVFVHHGTSHILLQTWSQDGAINSVWLVEGIHRQRPFTHQATTFQHCSSTTFDMPRRGRGQPTFDIRLNVKFKFAVKAQVPTQRRIYSGLYLFDFPARDPLCGESCGPKNCAAVPKRRIKPNAFCNLRLDSARLPRATPTRKACECSPHLASLQASSRCLLELAILSLPINFK